jgi:hypothetical protein
MKLTTRQHYVVDKVRDIYPIETLVSVKSSFGYTSALYVK